MDDCRREFVNDLGLRLFVGVDTGCVGGVGRPVDNGEGYAENDVCRGAVAGPGRTGDDVPSATSCSGRGPDCSGEVIDVVITEDVVLDMLFVLASLDMGVLEQLREYLSGG